MLASVTLALAGGAFIGSVAAFRRTKKQTFVAKLRSDSSSAALHTSKAELRHERGDDRLREVHMTDQAANRYLSASLATMGLATLAQLGLGFLNLLTLPLLVYLSLPMLREGYQQTFQARRIGFDTMNMVLLALLVGFGHIFTSGLNLALYYLSVKLVTSTRRKSEATLTSVFHEIPGTAWVLLNGVETEIPLGQIQPGDLIVVQAGQVIPVDGHIARGMATIDQRMLTGEAQPAEKEEGDDVFAATSLLTGEVVIRVEKTGAATIAAQIETILHNTATYESAAELRGQTIADRSALPMLLLSTATLPVLGSNSALAVLMCYFGTDLRVTAPLSILNHLRVASHNRILIKDGRALEALQAVDTIVFDKTGTLTSEQPHVAQIHAYNGYGHDTVLQFAAAAEAKLSHPIARAICQAAAEQGGETPTMDDTAYEIGFGVKARIADHAIALGSQRFMEMECIPIPAAVDAIRTVAHTAGHSLVYLAIDETLAGVIELHTTVRPEIRTLIDALKRRDMQMYILSGDQQAPTQHLAERLGMDGFYADVLPEDKARLVEQLQQDGRTVCFVGDGINDAIALKKANVSISLQGASTVAVDSAQIVLLDGNLMQLAHLFEIGDGLEENMRTNLALAIIPALAGLGGIYILHLGLHATMFLGYLGFGVGLGNAMLPRAHRSVKRDEPQALLEPDNAPAP